MIRYSIVGFENFIIAVSTKNRAPTCERGKAWTARAAYQLHRSRAGAVVHPEAQGNLRFYNIKYVAVLLDLSEFCE